MPGLTRACGWAGYVEMAGLRQFLGRGTLGRLLRHRSFVIGAVLFGAMLLLALLAPWLGSGDPNKMAERLVRQPSWQEIVNESLILTRNGESIRPRVMHGTSRGVW